MEMMMMMTVDKCRYYSEKIDNLGGSKAPAGVGKMWGGTSNHNGFLYDKG